jgi:ubiquinone biosynthesis protein COQ9
MPRRSRTGRRGDRPPAEERRWNLELRARLDEIREIARHLSRHAAEMTEAELQAQQERIEWLAEEIWRAAVYGPIEKRTP